MKTVSGDNTAHFSSSFESLILRQKTIYIFEMLQIFVFSKHHKTGCGEKKEEGMVGMDEFK